MGILILLLEIAIAGYLVVRLGTEAHDKGLSKGLFIFLGSVVWIGSRIIGKVIAYLMLGMGWKNVFVSWILAILTYILFFFIISRMKDEELFNEHDDEWKQQNEARSKSMENRNENDQ